MYYLSRVWDYLEMERQEKHMKLVSFHRQLV